MMMKMNRPSINMPTCGSVMLQSPCAPVARCRVRSSLRRRCCCSCRITRFGLLDVVQPLRPLAQADAQDAADDLGDALQEQKHAGDRDQGLERKHRDAGRAEDAHLAEPDRHLGVVPAGIDEGQHRRQEEDDVEHEVHGRLRARLPEAVDHVGAHVAVARQRVGAGHQEQGAVGDVAEVERPGGRRAQHVAHEHLVADAERQHQDQPGERLADPGAERVDEEQKARHARFGTAGGRARPPRQGTGGVTSRRPSSDHRHSAVASRTVRSSARPGSDG